MLFILYFCFYMREINQLINLAIKNEDKQENSTLLQGFNASPRQGELICLIGKNSHRKSIPNYCHTNVSKYIESVLAQHIKFTSVLTF